MDDEDALLEAAMLKAGEEYESNHAPAPAPAPAPFQVFAAAAASKRRKLDAPAHDRHKRSWSCEACTFENHGTWKHCKMCSAERTTKIATIEAAAEALGLRNGFRPWQTKVLEAWHAGKDCLILSGTGSGKSVCFQAPALLHQHEDEGGIGMVLVVSP